MTKPEAVIVVDLVRRSIKEVKYNEASALQAAMVKAVVKVNKEQTIAQARRNIHL